MSRRDLARHALERAAAPVGVAHVVLHDEADELLQSEGRLVTGR